MFQTYQTMRWKEIVPSWVCEDHKNRWKQAITPTKDGVVGVLWTFFAEHHETATNAGQLVMLPRIFSHNVNKLLLKRLGGDQIVMMGPPKAITSMTLPWWSLIRSLSKLNWWRTTTKYNSKVDSSKRPGLRTPITRMNMSTKLLTNPCLNQN